MIRIKGLDHVVIRATNLEKMVEFYCDVLGCKVDRKSSPEIGLVQLRAGDSLIDIVSVDGKIGRSGGLHREKKAGTWTTFVFAWKTSRKKRFAPIWRNLVSMAVASKFDMERKGMVRQYTYRTLKEIRWNSKGPLIDSST